MIQNIFLLIEFLGSRWGELESGQTTIAFTPLHQHETDDLTGTVHTLGSRGERQPIEVCFAYPDVDAAYKVENHYFHYIYIYIYIYIYYESD